MFGTRQAATTLLIVMIKKHTCAHVESCFAVGGKVAYVVDQHLGVVVCFFLERWRQDDRPTNVETDDDLPVQAQIPDFVIFGPPLPGTRVKDQSDLLTLVRGSLAMELFADSSALCSHLERAAS